MNSDGNTNSTPAITPPQVRSISLREAFLFWLKLGFISFGGPAGQISIMHQELVERRRWISEKRFLHALNYCMLLPGPEAQQLATYIGWLMHGVRGGLAAGMLFVLPSLLLLALKGHVWRHYGLVMAVANVAGSLLGTRVALKHGAGFVRVVFIVVVSALILKTAYDAFLK